MASRDRVFLTGATGFVGSHILRELLDSGYTVRALVRNGKHIDERAESVEGDLRDVGAFAPKLRGCRYLVHCAALYTFSPRAGREIAAVNVDGTASLLMAAHLAGIQRTVLTSSSATLGHAQGRYHRSKLEQERVAFAARIPTTALLPTAPVGPGDHKPTPTGKLVLDFTRGNIVAKAPGSGGMNLVAVEDVARAHVAALQLGRPGTRYAIGGENLSMDEIWTMLSEITGRPLPKWRAPYALAIVAGCADELRSRITGAEPDVPLEGVRMSRERMYADSSNAQRDLEYRPSPVRHALERAVAWFRDNGYVR
ncbi:MAG TPA: NAD-dependent epimerase/dehydratase family protein [Candidatus Cybelea sp.]